MPTLSLLPWHMPAQEGRCHALGKRLSGRERLSLAGSPVTLAMNRAYSFDCTRLSLYLCLQKCLIREFACVEQMVAILTQDQCFPVTSGHHPLPELLSLCDIFHLTNVMDLKWPLPAFAIFALTRIQSSKQF